MKTSNLVSIFLFLSYALLYYSSYAIKINDIKILNFTNLVSPKPFFVLDVNFSNVEDNLEEEINHEHELVIFEVSLDKNKKKYILGDNMLFEKVGSNRIRTFVPSEFSLKPDKDYTLKIRILEGKEIIFSQEFNLKSSSISNLPYLFTNNLRNIEISRSLTNSHRFFFFFDRLLDVSVISNGSVITNIKPSTDPNFKNLYYFDYTFKNIGSHEFIVGDCRFNVNVSFDKTPPIFMLLFPTNNAVFYRTNSIAFKWTDPIDSVGIDKSNSFLRIYHNSELITNIGLSYLNRESILMPYEVLYMNLTNEGSYNLELSYQDFDGNTTNASVSFSIASANDDKEPPKVLKVSFEGGRMISNVVSVPKGRVLVNVSFDDGVYGSGIRKVTYRYGEKEFEDLVFGNFTQFFIDVEQSGVFEIFAEDFGGNKGEVIKFYLRISR